MLILLLFPVLLRVLLLVGLLIWPLAYSFGSGNAPSVTCKFTQEVGFGFAGISLLVVPGPLPLLMPALLLIDGSLLIFRSLLTFVLMLRWRMLPALLLVNPFGLPAGWILLIVSLRHPLVLFRMSGMFTGMFLEFVLVMLFLPFGMLLLGLLLMIFLCIWSGSAEAGLFRAYSFAGGPTTAGSSSFHGRGQLRIRSRRLGSRAVSGKGSGRLYRTCQGDAVDKQCAQFFVNSSLSPVLLFREGVLSLLLMFLRVSKIKASLRLGGMFFLRYCGAVCRQGPCGPITSLHPWDDWIPLDVHGFYKWVFDSFELLNNFLKRGCIS